MWKPDHDMGQGEPCRQRRLRAASSYVSADAAVIARNADRHERMRARFGDMMKHTSHAGAFDFMTSSMVADGVDMKELPKIPANIEGVDSLTGKPAKTVKK